MATRQQIIDAYWPGGLPRGGPDAIVDTSTSGQVAAHAADIRRAKVLRFALAGGLYSSIHVYWPAATECRRALIYHSGHSSSFPLNWVTVGEALSRGIIVAEVFMSGYMSQPAPYYQQYPCDYQLTGGGAVTLNSHDDFASVTAAGDPVLPVFLDPVFRVGQWLRTYCEVESLGIVGHSGGGWTALLAAALDETIDYACSIHGWCPIGATGEPTRDYEQIGPWFDTTGYLDYAAMIGSRRNIVITGTLDPVFGEGVLTQAQIDGWTATLKAAGANFDQYTIAAADHDPVADEGVKACDEFDALGAAYWLCPRYSDSLANATQMAACLTTLAGYPAKGTGGTLVPQATWDGTPPIPAGWTAAYTATDDGLGNGHVNMSAQDYDRLYGDLSALSGADQTFVAAERWSIVGR